MDDLLNRLRRDRRRDPFSGRQEYSQAARELAARCQGLIAAGDAASAVPVLRKAVDPMTAALQYMDSSSGALGNDLDYLMHLYAQACAAAPPKPASLASWLVKLVFDGPGWPDVRLNEWAPALGPRGLAEVDRLVAEREASDGFPHQARRRRLHLLSSASDGSACTV